MHDNLKFTMLIKFMKVLLKCGGLILSRQLAIKSFSLVKQVSKNTSQNEKERKKERKKERNLADKKEALRKISSWHMISNFLRNFQNHLESFFSGVNAIIEI